MCRLQDGARRAAQLVPQCATDPGVDLEGFCGAAGPGQCRHELGVQGLVELVACDCCSEDGKHRGELVGRLAVRDCGDDRSNSFVFESHEGRQCPHGVVACRSGCDRKRAEEHASRFLSLAVTSELVRLLDQAAETHDVTVLGPGNQSVAGAGGQDVPADLSSLQLWLERAAQ